MADRESAINAVIDVLHNAEKVKEISRQFKSFEEISDALFPYLIVEEDEAGEDNIEYKSGGFANIKFVLNIIGYVNSSVDLAAEINKLDKEVKKVLGTDFLNNSGIMRSAGLIGFTIQPLRQKTGTEFNPYGSFVRPILLEYEGLTSTGL